MAKSDYMGRFDKPLYKHTIHELKALLETDLSHQERKAVETLLMMQKRIKNG